MSIDTATGKEAPADLSSARVKEIFSAIAKKYERFNAVSSFGAYKAWLAGMMRQAPIGPDDDVLDIAGGSLVCLEFSTPPNAVWRALYGFYLKHLIPFWGGLITGDREGFVYLARSIKAFPDQQGLAAMMEKAGFEDVIWKNYTGGIAAVHVARKPAR